MGRAEADRANYSECSFLDHLAKCKPWAFGAHSRPVGLLAQQPSTKLKCRANNERLQCESCTTALTFNAKVSFGPRTPFM